jgi:hypothetical protein
MPPETKQTEEKLSKEEVAKREALKKEAAAKKAKKEAEEKAKLPPPKFYFDVKVECMLPATLTYRVLAEDARQAAELIKGQSPTQVKHKLIGRKEIKLTVYDAGSSMIKWMQNLFGGR